MERAMAIELKPELGPTEHLLLFSVHAPIRC